MRVRNKILVSQGIGLVLMTLVICWGIVHLVRLGQASSAILEENYQSILAAESMRNALERQDSALLHALTKTGATSSRDMFQTNESRFLQWQSRADNNITIPEETGTLHDLDSLYTAFRSATTSYWTGLDRGTSDPASYYSDNIQPLVWQLQENIERLRDLNQEAMYTASDQAKSVAHAAIVSTIAVGLIGLVLSIVLSVLVARKITNPLQTLATASQQIAQGDYDVTIPVDTEDELGQLAEEFNRMATQLQSYEQLNIDQIMREKQKNEAILTSIEDGIILINSAGKVVNFNPAAAELFRRSWTAGSPPIPMEQLIQDETLLDHLQTTIDEGDPLEISDEERITTLGGLQEDKFYAYTITPFTGHTSGLEGMILHLRDVTRLKQLDQLKSEFVMAASHELRTPLTSIGMSIAILREHLDETLSEKDADMLETAHTEIRRLKSLVNDLLELSKIETGRIQMTFERTPASLITERIRSVFANQFDEKSIRFTEEIPDDLPEVKADSNKITWVITNLISNAIRYVKSGGQITLSAQHTHEHVYISVADDGAGIPEEYQSKIFDRFVQVQEDNHGGGSGLGLAICKEIVRAHGGTIWVESDPGEGSTFTFTLPVVAEAHSSSSRDETK
ncbi:MAG: cell wall metabolism sensor histidine kinase WalK [Candidatus Marinimicrobia bacterium]|nr:cell wall metabolism sensor histidine kinase WalK [Candidatus Neomarinimicrobiota bacterium]MCF7829650.1 cell wall metabolism sensor histidine kinase WalK [Candidatus Neomarinimicrobiota bacterium]MCF7879810.1 cell wall metabolism sensor histidine kinase WalK [Candidatus Neomarinimicrobiota bacterium]